MFSTLRVCFALAVLTLLSGCVRVNEGNFGIVKNWDRTYKNTPSTGIEWVVLDSMTEVYGRERLIQIVDVRPKDRENVMLQDLDLTVGYRVDPTLAIEFVRKRGDVTRPEELNGVYVVGETYIQRDAKSIIGETIRKFRSEDLLNNKRKVEEEFKIDLQAELDELYGKGVFSITEVKIANVIVSPSIEERIQSVALINSEKTKAEAIGKILEVRLSIQTREMQVLAQVAKDSGLSVDQVLEARRLDILRDMPTTGVTLAVGAERK